MPSPSGRRPEQVLDLEFGLAEERVGAFLFEHDDRAQKDADRRARHPAVVGQDRLALVRGQELQRGGEILEVEQRQVVVVAVLEDERQDRRLRLVQVEHLAEEQRTERAGRSPVPARRASPTATGIRPGGPDGDERPVERGHTLDELRVGRVTRRRETRQVALDVGHEDRHARLGQLPGEELERLGLAGPGRAGDEAVAIEHGQGDLDASVVDRLAVEHGAAEDDALLGLRQRIGCRHGVVERLVHGPSGASNEVSWGGFARVSSAPVKASMMSVKASMT